FDDFGKVDIRVGTVIKADVPEWSHWVIRMEVNFGPEIGKKKAFSGIMKFFKPEDLTGKQFPFVVNLEPKKIGPERELSEAMMIMAVPKEDEETPTVLFKLPKKVPNGTKVR
ncbi:MAG: tRNA-binding protein, partial [Candidatus Woesebacteria bacterium]|nr:tRNA-binding protein [Candidatus Woesebacteria bacterium]